jgi:hypothetical protein
VQFVPTPRLTILGWLADSSMTPSSTVGVAQDFDDVRCGLREQLAESSAIRMTTVLTATKGGV